MEEKRVRKKSAKLLEAEAATTPAPKEVPKKRQKKLQMDSRKERKPFSLIASLREKIFHYLPARDAFALAATCHDWARSLKGPYFERIASAEFPKIRVLRALLSSPKPSFKEMYAQQLAARQGEERVVESSLADYVFTLEISLSGNDEKEEDAVRFTWVGEAADLSSSNVVLSFKHPELHACKYVYDVTSQPHMLDCVEIKVHLYATSRSSGHTVLVASPCNGKLSSCDGEKLVFTGGQKQGIYSTWEQFGDNSERSCLIFPYIPTYINELLHGGMAHSVHLEWDLEMHFGDEERTRWCNQLKLSEVVFTPSLFKSADWGEIKQKIPRNDFFAMLRSSLN